MAANTLVKQANVAPPKPVCTKCNYKEHFSKQCRAPASISQINNTDYEEDHDPHIVAAFEDDNVRQHKFAHDEKIFGKCPVCSQKHTYPKKVGNQTYA